MNKEKKENWITQETLKIAKKRKEAKGKKEKNLRNLMKSFS